MWVKLRGASESGSVACRRADAGTEEIVWGARRMGGETGARADGTLGSGVASVERGLERLAGAAEVG